MTSAAGSYMQNLTPEQRTAHAKKSHEARRRKKAERERYEQEVLDKAILKKHGLEQEIEQLEAKLADLKHQATFNHVAPKLTGHTLCREEEIIAGSIPAQQFAGVYFLIRDNRVVYVGQSVNVYARVQSHGGPKAADRYAFIFCAPEILDKLESLYIHYLKPENNGHDWTGAKHAPLSLESLLSA